MGVLFDRWKKRLRCVGGTRRRGTLPKVLKSVRACSAVRHLLSAVMRARPGGSHPGQGVGRRGLPNQARSGADAAPPEPAREQVSSTSRRSSRTPMTRSPALSAPNPSLLLSHFRHEICHGCHAVPRAPDRPRAVFDAPERRDRTRFMVPDGDDWRAVTWGQVADEIRDIGALLGERPPHRRPRRHLRGQPRRVDERRAGDPGRGGVLVPIYPASTRSRPPTCSSTPTRGWSSSTRPRSSARLRGAGRLLRQVERIVLLDDNLDAARCSPRPCAPRASASPPIAEVAGKRVVGWAEVGRAAPRAPRRGQAPSSAA
jgi:hypothetical protein